MTTLITPGLVTLDDDLGPEKSDVLRALAERLVAQGRATDADAVYADLLKREEKDSTGIPGGIAIPHARSAAVLEPTLVMSRLKPGVDFGAGDGPADLVFSIAVPDGADDAHLSLLSTLARSLIRPDFTQSLREATTPEQIVEIVGDVLDPKPAEPAPAAPAPAAVALDKPAAEAPAAGKTRIVAITACATGIAHTFMAADTLTMAAKNRDDVQLDVEPQGSSKVTPLDPAIVAAADAVIFAVDVDVREKHRFVGKPVIQVPVKRGIDAADELLDRAIAATKDPSAPRVSADASASAAESGPAKKESVGARLKRWLMTGVSYMIPFVAGGGLLMALGFLLGGYSINEHAKDIILQNSLFNLPEGGIGTYLGAVAFSIGAASMGFLVPALAGYIAFGIADRPGIAPGFVAGAVALLMNAGFLGGLVGGLLAGWIAWYLSTLNPPKWLRGLMPVVIIPLVGSIVASGAMILFLGGPISALMNGLNEWLSGLTGTGAILLGIILGTMMCVDLGGPVNKVAYSFAVAGLGAGSFDNPGPWLIMAAVMGAGMVPPIAVSIATFIAPKLFSPLEHENGKSAWLLGAAFISEGAIPFAAGDPLRVIPSSIVGGALTGALTMAMGVTSQAPHGGIFVFFAIGNVLGFVVAVLAGAVVTALVLVALKKWARKPAAPVAAEAAPAEAVAA